MEKNIELLFSRVFKSTILLWCKQKTMKILLVTQYFWPEQFIINDLVRHLDSQGHKVKVLTGKPNYPEGDIFEGYSQTGLVEEKFSDNIEIKRVPLRPRKIGKLNLLRNYCSFVWNGLRHFPKMVKGEQFDVILVFAVSPITMAILAIYLKTKLKTHLAIWVQDLWPESLSATGHITNRYVLKLVGLLVKAIYYFADTLLIQSKGFYQPVSQYASKDKIVYYPNSIDQRSLVCDSAEDLPSGLAEILESNFCIIFAGNIGKAQSIETIVDAAQILKVEQHIKLIIVGSGSMLEWCQCEKEKRNLTNLILPGRFPSTMMSKFFNRAGGLLVSLKDQKIFRYTIPSKIQSYMASGKPIIASINGEGGRIINEAQAGLTCNAEDAEGLASSIKLLYEMSDAEKEKMGGNGLKYFVDNYEMGKQAGELVKIFEQRI